MEKTLTPAFQQTDTSTATNSPLSPNPTDDAVEHFNHSVKLMNVFKRNSNDANCQGLVTWFAQTEVCIGSKEFQRTVFLRNTFSETQVTVTELTARTWSNFFSTWAELEVGEEYNDQVFPMGEILTHAASPVVTGDWTLDAYSQGRAEWESNHPPSPGSLRSVERGARLYWG